MASILVIDDDRAVLSTIKLLLERAGHAVEAVDRGRAGLRLIFCTGDKTRGGFESAKAVQTHELLATVAKSLSDSPKSSEPSKAAQGNTPPDQS